MKVYSLTNLGNSVASNPVANPPPTVRILYWIRGNGGKATDDQLIEKVEPDKGQLQIALNKLIRAKTITVLG